MSVYFAQVGRYIKIGYSADPMSRMTTVTRNGERPADIERGADAELIGWIPGDRKRESELHRKFAEAYAAGEWFVLDAPPVRDLIWADPHGIDMQRMAARAVFAAVRFPDLTRDELASCGLRIEAATEDEAMESIGRALGATA